MAKLSELLQYNLKSVHAHLQREDFQRFWQYRSPYWAGRFLHDWCVRVMRSHLDPMKKVVGTLRTHQHLLLNWFRAKGQFSAGVVERLNNKAKVTMRKSYGFRTPETLELALYHNLAKLPEPNFTSHILVRMQQNVVLPLAELARSFLPRIQNLWHQTL